ncbi:MAG: hypothetical protein KF910_03685 [Brevundimonas sp.]|uniref:hypothetical protein n=1 Tax=Brevundimonas sp. TaxID=1871086 RepID=UPI0025BD9937|nr:hypothetical protein [Brevundimonas sp.]MBX3476681.1 hypothetical protein [Brevundimonas sp.]
MGRPALNLEKIQIRLSKAVIDRIDAIAGSRRRPAFIREAVESELKRREGKGD